MLRTNLHHFLRSVSAIAWRRLENKSPAYLLLLLLLLLVRHGRGELFQSALKAGGPTCWTTTTTMPLLWKFRQRRTKHRR
jgi:hypothetical protein